MLNIFIGYDSKESIAFSVLCHSIITRTSVPVSITPIVQKSLRQTDIYTRERTQIESTEFSMTRFLVPYLSDYTGFSIFMDCDMLCRVDLVRILEETDLRNAVSVCQHDYVPSTETKNDGQIQTKYERKNWSSLMVFNNSSAACKRLTPEYVNKATGLDLHRFRWTDDRLGSIDIKWNWLVGEYKDNPEANILHYTLGGPWFQNHKETGHSKDWLDEYESMIRIK